MIPPASASLSQHSLASLFLVARWLPQLQPHLLPVQVHWEACISCLMVSGEASQF